MWINGEPFWQHRKKMIQISLRVQPVRLGGFQQCEDNHAGVGSGLGITEQPVLSAYNIGPNRVLNLVVADFNLPMVEERAKVLLLVEGVDYRLLQLACRFEDRLQPRVVFVNDIILAPAIPKEGFVVHRHLAVGEALPDTPGHVFADAAGFLLRHAGHDCQQQLDLLSKLEVAFYASLDDDQSTIDSRLEMGNVATPSSESTASVDTEVGSEDTIENGNVESGKTEKTTESVDKAVEAAEKRVEEDAKEAAKEALFPTEGIDVNSWADPELAVSEEAYQDFEDAEL